MEQKTITYTSCVSVHTFLFSINYQMLCTQELILQLRIQVGALQVAILTSGVEVCAEMLINLPLPAKLQL